MKKTLSVFLKVTIGLYIIVCGLLYFFQEKVIFFPEYLDQEYQFQFNQEFEEMTIQANDGASLHGLLFRADSTKGLIFYLHGNAGSLRNWGNVAKSYTDLNYDIFIPDYRSYGKSEGDITSQEQLFQDNQIIYEELKKMYNEDQMVVLGYSIGSGMAAQLASINNPRLVILQAPYYSLVDLMRHTYPWIPTFILKYTFETNQYLKNCEMPIVIFHGAQDRVIYYESSVKLKQDFDLQVTLITLQGQGHNGMTYNQLYQKEIKDILK